MVRRYPAIGPHPRNNKEERGPKENKKDFKKESLAVECKSEEEDGFGAPSSSS